MIKREEILKLEKQAENLENELKNLEDSFNKRNLKKFKNSKQNLFNSIEEMGKLAK